MKVRNRLPACYNSGRALAGALLLFFVAYACPGAAAPNVKLDSMTTPSGYLAGLLINETPFPGERGYESENNTRAAMLAILWVLHSRIHHIPDGYTQARVADIRSKNIIEVITAGSETGKGQCDGFYKKGGKPVTAPRVKKRIDYLVSIANKGDKPGRFANLLNYAKTLSQTYMKEGITGADRYAALKIIGKFMVTGRAYSWMTDQDCYNPGGFFIAIPDVNKGSLGGNRFFTLQKDPK